MSKAKAASLSVELLARKGAARPALAETFEDPAPDPGERRPTAAVRPHLVEAPSLLETPPLFEKPGELAAAPAGGHRRRPMILAAAGLAAVAVGWLAYAAVSADGQNTTAELAAAPAVLEPAAPPAEAELLPPGQGEPWLTAGPTAQSTAESTAGLGERKRALFIVDGGQAIRPVSTRSRGHETAPPEAAPPEAALAAVVDAPEAEQSGARPPTPRRKPSTAGLTEDGGFEVQLSAVKSAEAADREWRRLRQSFPALLGDKTLRVDQATFGGDRVVYRLRAGPYQERAVARDLCATLKANAQDCLVVVRRPNPT